MTIGQGINTVVMISGSGTNLQAIIDAVTVGKLPITLAAVISDNPGAYGLERARVAGVATRIVDYRECVDRAEFDRRLAATLAELAPNLIVLAGFMRILGDDVVHKYRERLLNIHPSLLPKYPGLDTYRRVLATDDRWHGSTVHFVTPELDAGPMLIQYRVRIGEAETDESLSARVQRGEYMIYPRAIEWFANGRVQLRGDRVWLDDQPLEQPVIVDEQHE